MVFSIIFLEDKHKILLHLSIFYEYVFSTPYLFLDTAARLPSHVTTHATHSDPWPGVEFKQKLQLASRTSRYKNQLAPPDILLARPSWGQLLKII
jgi:hypothetical protein